MTRVNRHGLPIIQSAPPPDARRRRKVCEFNLEANEVHAFLAKQAFRREQGLSKSVNQQRNKTNELF